MITHRERAINQLEGKWGGRKGGGRERETKYPPSTIVEADKNILRIGAELLFLNVDVMEESHWCNYGVLVFSFSGFPI